MHHALAQFCFRLIALCPLWLVRGLGAALGVLSLLDNKTRTDLRNHLVGAGQTLNKWKIMAHSGMSALEMPWILLRSQASVLAKVNVQGLQLYQDALARGGLVLLAPHMGSFEVIGTYAITVAPLTAMYKPPQKPWLAPLLVEGRMRHGLQLAPANTGGVRLLLKAIKRGEAVIVLPDQVPSLGDGVMATWFGQPAYTMTLPMKLIGSSSQSPLMVCAIRTWRGWTIQFSSCALVASASSEHDAAQLNAAVAEIVALAPAQYWWVYNRYKASQ